MVTELFLVCSTLICRWREQLQMELLLKDIFGVTFIFFDGCWEQFLVYLALVCRWKNVTTSNRITLTTRFKIVKTRPKSPKRIMVWMLIKVRLGYTYPSPTVELIQKMVVEVLWILFDVVLPIYCLLFNSGWSTSQDFFLFIWFSIYYFISFLECDLA